MSVPPFWPNVWVDFFETWHNDRFGPNLKHGLKIWEMVTIVTEKAKNGIFARKTIGARDLKFGMNIQLHSGSNMGCVPPGHTSSFLCVRLLMPKMVFQPKHLNLRS